MDRLEPSRDDRTAVERIGDPVLACSAVVDLHGGPFGTVATLLPRRRVIGIHVDGAPDPPEAVAAAEVHVVGRYPHRVADIAAQVRTAVRTVVPQAEVIVTIEDYR